MTRTIYYLLDCSGSMTIDNRGDNLNTVMERMMNEGVDKIKDAVGNESNLKFSIYAFRRDSEIKIHTDRVNINDISGFAKIVDFAGSTPTGLAIKAVANDYAKNREPDEHKPAVILISDGEPTGTNPTYEEALQWLEECERNELPEGEVWKSNRIAIGTNVNSEGRESLKKFGHVESKLSEVVQPYYDATYEDLDALVKLIIEVSVTVSR